MRQPARPDLWEAWVGNHPGPPGSVERTGRSQLIPGVRPLERRGKEVDETRATLGWQPTRPHGLR